MHFALTVSSDNQALADDDRYTELARLLREAADHVDAGRTTAVLHDYNGNVVGSHRED